MDNKQATPTDLAYFAGIVDGEGWIGLQKHFVKGKFTAYSPHVRVINTDPNIIERIQSIWASLGIEPYLNEQQPSTGNGKIVLYVEIHKQSLIKKTLEAILPYLVGKKARATMLLRFIDKTMDREEAYQGIRKANQKGVSSETTREAAVATATA